MMKINNNNKNKKLKEKTPCIKTQFTIQYNSKMMVLPFQNK
jgi:hypothetical protein